MNQFQIPKKVLWLRSGRLLLSILLLSFLLLNLAQAQEPLVFPEGKSFIGADMTHRYQVIGTTSDAGRDALQRIVEAKNTQLTGVGLPPIQLPSADSALTSIAFDHMKDIRDPLGNRLPGSEAERFRVTQSVLGYWVWDGEFRYVWFIFDTGLFSNNATLPNWELATIRRSIRIGKLDDPEDDSSEIEKLNYREVDWRMESLDDPNHWVIMKAKFAYDLDFDSVTSFPAIISSGTHVAEVGVGVRPLDVIMPHTEQLFTFDRRFYRVGVSMNDLQKLSLKFSSPDSDIQAVFDNTEWNEFREEVFTSSTFIRD